MTTIRPATPDDAPFVTTHAARLAAFGPPPFRSMDEIVRAEVRALRAFFDAPPAGAALLIAEAAGERLGFVYLERLRDYFTQDDHGHIGMLVVAEEAAGRGVGSALIREAESWARRLGYDRLTLTVFEGNRAARDVYEHLGYTAETLRYVKILSGPA